MISSKIEEEGKKLQSLTNTHTIALYFIDDDEDDNNVDDIDEDDFGNLTYIFEKFNFLFLNVSSGAMMELHHLSQSLKYKI